MGGNNLDAATRLDAIAGRDATTIDLGFFDAGSVRDAAANDVGFADTGTPDSGNTGCAQDPCPLQGTLLGTTHLTNDRRWRLIGEVYVGDDSNPAVLRIDPGTTILGDSASKAVLIITRGARIEANGTAQAPIVFTSSRPAGTRQAGDWGGIVIRGRATINLCGTQPCEAMADDSFGRYGGSNDADSSGVLRYLRIEFGAGMVAPGVDLNGIGFYGVGSGTVIENILAHRPGDDGFQFAGGTAQFKRLITTGAQDECFDWNEGWRGKGQFFICQQFAAAADNGVVGQNNNTDDNALPRSGPVLAGMTIVGSPTSFLSDLGLLLRAGTDARISSSIFTGFEQACVDIDTQGTWARAQSGNVTLTSTLFDCALNFLEEAEDPVSLESFILDMDNNITAPAGLTRPFDELSPSFVLRAGSAAFFVPPPPSDPFFETTTFIGAMGSTDWTAGWTAYPAN